jgi:hypothetical protein
MTQWNSGAGRDAYDDFDEYALTSATVEFTEENLFPVALPRIGVLRRFSSSPYCWLSNANLFR